MKRWAAVFALLAGLVALPSPAQAALVWHGHELHRAEVEASFAKLPERGKAKDVEIAVYSKAEWHDLVPQYADDILGFYEEKTHRISLLGDYSGLPIVAAHEIGHHVFYTALKKSERKAWGRFWKAHQADMPGDYARTSASEGFADCFAETYVGVLTQEGDKPIPPVVDAEIRSFFP